MSRSLTSRHVSLPIQPGDIAPFSAARIAVAAAIAGTHLGAGT